MKLLRLFIFLAVLTSSLAFSAWIEDLSEKNQNIALFIGTFDPFHDGHKKIINELIASGRFQSVVVIPNDKPLYKPLASSIESRLKALQAVYSKHPNIYVPRSSQWSFPISVSVFKSLKNQCEGCSFSGIFGDDIFTSLLKTYSTRLLLPDLKKWIVFTRNQIAEVPKFIFNTPVEVFSFKSPESSSHIRKQLRDIAVRSENAEPRVNLPATVLERILFENMYAGNESYFKTGDVIAFSLRKGFTPKVVQTVSESVFDHVGILSWEGKTLYIYEFLLGKGVVKSVLQDKWNAYRDANGETHYAILEGLSHNNSDREIELQTFLKSAADQFKHQFNSCTDFVLKSLESIGKKINFNAARRTQLINNIKLHPKIERYQHLPIFDIIMPIEIVENLKLVVTSEKSFYWSKEKMDREWHSSQALNEASIFQCKSVFE